MRGRITFAAIVLLSVAVSIGWPSLSWAYKPHVGDRAADFAGRDIVGGGSVHLDDYRGRWVLLEFWSSH
jgi:hypothetical protein